MNLYNILKSIEYKVCINGQYCTPALLKHRNRQARAQAPVGIKTGFAIKEGWIRSRCFRTAEPRQQPQIKNTSELASEQKG